MKGKGNESDAYSTRVQSSYHSMIALIPRISKNEWKKISIKKDMIHFIYCAS